MDSGYPERVDVDAVVIGAGQNGLVAANRLADAGWSVLVLETAAQPGGAVRSGELTLPGYEHDFYSAFYPLGYASPVLRTLDLERHGVRWTRSEAAVAHPNEDGRCALLSTRLEETMASLDAFHPGDGRAWEELYEYWRRLGPHLLRALMTPFPPVRPGLRMMRALGSPRDLVRFARFGILPVRRLADESFEGEGGGWLLAGNALHADLTPEGAGSGLFGWLLCMLGQQYGYPVPVGGASRLVEALVRRLEERGGRVECGRSVTAIELSGRRASAVRTADGDVIGARRAVLADTSATALYRDLLPDHAVPAAVQSELDNFHWDNPTVKVDWALKGPIPWACTDARRAGTVHVADGMYGLTMASTHLASRLIPERPSLVLGQYSMVDATRMPEGHEVAWAYTHVPHEPVGDAGGELSGRWENGEMDRFAERIENEVERLAPGFRKLILKRHVFTPADLEAANANLVGGAVNNGTAQLHQQVVFRPVPGTGRPETPVRGLYLCSAATHPGGGVHGGPGSNAARVALAHDRLRIGA